eukprot:316184-Prymnesium_polylepis.1
MRASFLKVAVARHQGTTKQTHTNKPPKGHADERTRDRQTQDKRGKTARPPARKRGSSKVKPATL